MTDNDQYDEQVEDTEQSSPTEEEEASDVVDMYRPQTRRSARIAEREKQRQEALQMLSVFANEQTNSDGQVSDLEATQRLEELSGPLSLISYGVQQAMQANQLATDQFLKRRDATSLLLKALRTDQKQ